MLARSKWKRMNTRVFFVTDVHGSERCFKKFLNAGKFYKANAVILAGDITGKMIVPIVKQPDATYLSLYAGSELHLKSEAEVQDLEKSIRDSGFYPYRTDSSEMQLLESDKKKVDQLFTKIMVDTVERWIHLAEERLRDSGIKCFISPGNDDRWEVDSPLNKSDFIVNPEEKVIEVDQHHEMITLGLTNHTPWKSPREFDEEVLAERIDRMAAGVKNMPSCIFNLHCPPYGTIIDPAPKLDETLKPVISGGQVVMAPAGSTAVRDAIRKYQPLTGLHGHIHESKGVASVGRTKCFNPGSEYGEGVLRGLLLDLTEKGIKSYLFTSG
jgi:Icc-related predicted phosphoesterase